MELGFGDPRDRGYDRVVQDLHRMEEMGLLDDAEKYTDHVEADDRRTYTLDLGPGDMAAVSAGYQENDLAMFTADRGQIGSTVTPLGGDRYHIGRGDDFSHRYVKAADGELSVRAAGEMRDATVSGNQIVLTPRGEGRYDVLNTGTNGAVLAVESADDQVSIPI